ncbi:MAG TPA: chemotaxis protein CheB [Longimicrobium sp.]|nr:chemotaxis protein CheB [Longimicrobium sp.]
MSHAHDPAAAARIPPVVAIAASAGGIGALEALLGALPAGFPAAVLALVHLQPGRVSILPRMLARATVLPVKQAAAMDRPRAGHVYVAAPDFHLVMGPGGRLQLSGADRENWARPSADPLFESVARVCGAGAFAVVLSGMGSDGSRGVGEVHRRGGTVIAQDGATSVHFAMPSASISTGFVDHVVPLPDIAPLLMRLLMPATAS